MSGDNVNDVLEAEERLVWNGDSKPFQLLQLFNHEFDGEFPPA